jgi:hypothetical protein
VRDVLLRGEVLIENGNYVGSRNAGRYMPRRLAPEVIATPLDPSLTRTSLSAAVR